MPYTGQQLIEAMRHRLGKTPSSRHQLIDSLNEAGRAIFTAAEGPPLYHSWTWVTVENAPLPIPADVEEVDVPADLGQVVSIRQESQRYFRVRLVDIELIHRLRSLPRTDTLDFYMAFDRGGPQPSFDAPPIKRASIYPKQDQPRTDISISYTRTWVDYLPPTLDRVAPVPAEWHGLLRLKCQITAMQREDDNVGSDMDAYMQELERLVGYDARRQTDYGPPRYSVIGAASGRMHTYPHERIER